MCALKAFSEAVLKEDGEQRRRMTDQSKVISKKFKNKQWKVGVLQPKNMTTTYPMLVAGSSVRRDPVSSSSPALPKRDATKLLVLSAGSKLGASYSVDRDPIFNTVQGEGQVSLLSWTLSSGHPVNWQTELINTDALWMAATSADSKRR